MAERYSLKPYQSTYVNRKSAEINEVLRQRYEQAFNADDAIAGAVDEMNAAGFAGDQALKKELEDSTRQELEQRASRGDYETMGMDVARSARNFQKQYAPLKQNFDLQTNYKALIDDAYKEKRIDAETYRRAMAKSVHDYEGLQRNEDGSIDQGSFFSGYNFVDDVNIDELMNEYMEDYAANEGGSIVTQVGQYRIGEDGKPILDAEGTQYAIKRGEKYEYISEAEVARAYNHVISRPEVQAYLQQKADLRTFDMTDEDLQANLMYDLDGDMSDPNNDGGLRGALEEAVEKGKTKEAEALQQIIDQKEALLKGTGVETPEEMMELRRRNARQEVIEGEAMRGQGAAMDKFGYQNVWTEYAEEYDKKWLQDRKAKLDAQGNFIPNVLTKSGMTQINNPGGDNIVDIETFIQDQDAGIAKEVKDLNSLLGGTNYTAEDIMSGKVTVDDLPEGVADNILEQTRDHIRMMAGEKSIQQRLMDEAKAAVGVQPLLDEFLGKNFGDKSGQDVLNKLKEITGNPNLSIEGLLAIQELAQSKSFRDSQSSSTAGYTMLENEITPEMVEAAEIMDQLNEFAFGKSNLPFGITSAKLNNALKNLNNDATSKINSWLEKNSKITVGGMASSVFPGLDPAAADKATKAIKGVFENNPLDKNYEIFYSGQKQDGTGTVASLIEEKGWDGEDVIVNGIKFHTTPFLGEPSLEVVVKGKKDGNDVYETIIMPYSNMKNQGLDDYFNDPSYKVAMEINRARNVGLPDTNIRFSNGAILKFEGLDGKGKEIIRAFDKDGKLVNTFDANSTVELQDGRKVKMLDQFIQEAAAGGQTFYTDIQL
jgi:hypothetical protein